MSNKSQRSVGIALVVIGLVSAVYILVRATVYDPGTGVIPIDDTSSNATSSVIVGGITSSSSTPATVTNSSNYPVRLIIPKINVNAGVQYVGTKADGSMGTPSNFVDVAWYKLGVVPGSPGNAVIAGHLDNALALSGVFKHLGSLAPGDEVEVREKNGAILTFKVDKVENYNYLNTPNQQIFVSKDGQAHLNLITCAGTWIQKAHSYDQRLVVYTTLEK